MHVWSTHQPPATFSSRGRRMLVFSSVCAAAWGRHTGARRAGRNAARAWLCRDLSDAASAWPCRAERMLVCMYAKLYQARSFSTFSYVSRD